MPKKTIELETKFFNFKQNNSGGSFTGPAINVIIEATSAKDANSRAEDIGLYFDGYGDCSCCGTRWSSQWDKEKGDEVPSIYGKPIDRPTPSFTDWSTKDIPHAIVYYIDGTNKVYKTKV